MQLDARTLSDQAILDADLCVVGAGPAGLSLAAELVGRPMAILVVESGSWENQPAVQALNDARIVGDSHAGLRTSRHRQVGGTARIWDMPLGSSQGAKFVPLDPIDFLGEQGRPAWPFHFGELESYYRRAQSVAGLGRFEHEASGWSLPPSPIPTNHPTFTTRIYQFGSSERFCQDLPALIAGASNITLCHGATLVALRWRRETVEALEAIAANGRRVTITARQVVLAAGGVENARILLVAADAGNLRDQSGWLGRGFMEHPRDYTLTLKPTSRSQTDRLEFFDARDSDGNIAGGRIAIRQEAILAEELPNASISLLPMGRALRPFHWRIESLAWRRLGWNLQWPPAYGWSRLPSLARRFDGFQLLINLEEYPHLDNYVTLDSLRDRFSVRRAVLHRRWHEADDRRLVRLRAAVLRGLEGLALGRLEVGPTVPPDPNSHHHLGTTRMGLDARNGVTDASGRVFGSDNLFVVGGSLFPSAGYANPTLTSIALALRLADHLSRPDRSSHGLDASS